MGKRLYVGNLAYKTRDDGLRAFFAAAGNVTAAEVIMMGRRSNRSKGFGFVEFATDEEATHARETLNGQLLDERPIRVDVANDKPERAEGDRRDDRPPRQDYNDRGNDRGTDRPAYSSDRPSYGNDRPAYSSDRPSGGGGAHGGYSSGGGGYNSDRGGERRYSDRRF